MALNCYAPMHAIVSNFIVLGQTVYEKSVTIFYTLHYFGAAGGPLRQKFTSEGDDV